MILITYIDRNGIWKKIKVRKADETQALEELEYAGCEVVSCEPTYLFD